MFKFFKKTQTNKDKKKEEVNKKASIEFYVEDVNDPRPRVNINIDDYDDESVLALCSIINVLSEESLIIETYNIIQSFLIQENKHDILMKVLLLISEKQSIKSKFSKSNEPYIKPSDLH